MVERRRHRPILFSRQRLRRPTTPFEGRDRHYLERVQANGTHLLSLINSILDLSKIEAGRMEVVAAPTDLASLVRETVSLLEGQPRADGVELRTDVPERSAPGRDRRGSVCRFRASSVTR